MDGERVGRVDFGSDDALAFGSRTVFTGLGEGTHRVRLVVRRGAAYVEGFVTRG